MNRVLDRLLIGNARDLDGTTPLPSLGIVAVVDLCGAAPLDAPRLSKCFPESIFRVANRDGDPWSKAQVEGALGFIADHIRHGKVLVACAAGMSRSASLVIGYLVSVGYDVATAHAVVQRARPCIAPMPTMLESVLGAVGVR